MLSGVGEKEVFLSDFMRSIQQGILVLRLTFRLNDICTPRWEKKMKVKEQKIDIDINEFKRKGKKCHERFQ